jgi:hypothetical protein
MKSRTMANEVRMREKRNVYRLFIRKPEGKRPLGRPRGRWIDDIKMHLICISWGGAN